MWECEKSLKPAWMNQKLRDNLASKKLFVDRRSAAQETVHFCLPPLTVITLQAPTAISSEH